ncbi:putative DVL protein [Tanacetum coccineum]
MTSSSSTSTATAQPTTTHFTYLDEKWKLSKKESSISRSRSSTSSSSFNRSNPSSTHHRRCAFTRKCARLVKEQRARFYIMRRCVTMLVCWRDYGDS